MVVGEALAHGLPVLTTSGRSVVQCCKNIAAAGGLMPLSTGSPKGYVRQHHKTSKRFKRWAQGAVNWLLQNSDGDASLSSLLRLMRSS